MGVITRPTKSSSGTTDYAAGTDILATEANDDYNSIKNEVNGNLEDVNVKAGAAINGSKFADNTVTGAKLADAPNGVIKNKINAASISSDKFDTTEYTNAGGLGAIAAGGTVEHDTLIAAASRQALVVWFTGAIGGQILLSLRVSGGTWFVSVYNSDSAPVTVNAAEVHMLHIAKS